MKKRTTIVSLTLFVTLLFPSLASASLDNNLKYGSHGQQVTELQEFLIAKNFLRGQASGKFYSLTRNAVIAYQTANGINPSGFVGPITRKQINDELALGGPTSLQAGTPVPGTGTTGSTVRGCLSTVGL